MSIDTMELDTAEKIAAIPIDEIDVSRPSLFQQDTIGLFFDRLRKEGIDAKLGGINRWATVADAVEAFESGESRDPTSSPNPPS